MFKLVPDKTAEKEDENSAFSSREKSFDWSVDLFVKLLLDVLKKSTCFQRDSRNVNFQRQVDPVESCKFKSDVPTLC